MNEKVRSRVRAAEMGFLQSISSLTSLDKLKSADIRESLNIKSLLLQLERSQLHCYGHMTRKSRKEQQKTFCSAPLVRRPNSMARLF